MMHIDVCYGLIYDKKADTVLVVQNEHGGWSFPGGAKEPPETLAQALLREIKEETELDVEIVGEIETSERYSPTHDIFHLFYVILKDEKQYGAPISHSDDEIMMVQWIAFDDVRVYLPWYKNGIDHLKDKIVTP
jgi:8-oxo-dGTP diphosphatase